MYTTYSYHKTVCHVDRAEYCQCSIASYIFTRCRHSYVLLSMQYRFVYIHQMSIQLCITVNAASVRIYSPDVNTVMYYCQCSIASYIFTRCQHSYVLLSMQHRFVYIHQMPTQLCLTVNAASLRIYSPDVNRVIYYFQCSIASYIIFSKMSTQLCIFIKNNNSFTHFTSSIVKT